MGRVLEQIEAWLAGQGESYRYSDDQPRDEAGRFGEGGGADSGGGGSVMSADEYNQTYEIYDQSTFDSDTGGTVTSMVDGDLQIAFFNEDGSVNVWADLTQEEADSIADYVSDFRDVDPADYQDENGDPLVTGDPELGGLIDYKDVAGNNDYIVGINNDFEISILSLSDPEHGIDLGDGALASAFENALRDESANAYQAEVYA
jgi:hypothetical protein